MYVLKPHSPDYALQLAFDSLDPESSVKTMSRNGPVIRFNAPVTTVWADPTNRILWSPTRDCNPFFHLIEAFWMLAGRNDVETVAKITASMGNYSDDGMTLNGAYGYRWRQHFGFDQIETIIGELKRDPGSRRCVLQMWDGSDELPYVTKGGRDACCNTAIFFDPCDGVLNMTVTNRSNDLVFGAYGANLVHMSILHEWVAQRTGLKLGTYYQVSNNLHLYTEFPVTKKIVHIGDDGHLMSTYSWDEEDAFSILPQYGFEPTGEALFSDVDPAIPEDVLVHYMNALMADFCAGHVQKLFVNTLVDDHPFPTCLRLLAVVMSGFLTYKDHGPTAAVEELESCGFSSQWVLACILWLKRRPSYKEQE